MSWQPTASIAALTARAELLAQIRGFFAQRAVLEVQTPLLGMHAVTDPDVEGVQVPGYGYLQTSPEYFMKRLLAAGLGDCYQLAAAFRHEEVGRLHNVEFTLLEWYRLGFDDQQLMAEVASLCDTLLGPQPYESLTYESLVGDLAAPRDVLDLRFAQACAKLTRGRYFVTHYPAEQAALARLHPADSRYAARFELIIDGVEIANGYWELTDADEHRQRFAQDLKIREKRRLNTTEVDHRFLAALDEGLPECAGVAVGVDRLLMLALGLESIEEVLAFRR
jgi:elongation factor P--(R)-beta-lysine ligase